jgi:hypothetical protein
LPLERNTPTNGPPKRFQIDPCEAKDCLFKQASHPRLFPIRRNKRCGASVFGRKCQIESQARKGNHETVRSVVPSDLVGGKFGASRSRPANTSTAERGRQSTALAEQVVVLNKPRHQLQRRTDKSVARRIHGQLFEAALDLASRKELPRFCRQDVNSASNSGERPLTMPITPRKIPTKAALYGVGQKPRYQFGDIVDVFFDHCVKGATNASQVGRVEH